FASLGVFERAAEGTVYLRNADALPAPLHNRLHAALASQQVTRVGAKRPVALRARLISATSAPLLEMAESGHFRRDLYYRLSVVAITMPPLRERREDIPLLANFLLEKINRRLGKRVDKVAFEAMLALTTYSWPGNVAELAERLESLVAADTHGVIRVADLPPALQREIGNSDNTVAAANVPLKEAKKRFEREYFKDLLRRTRGNMSLASRSSRVGRPYLYKKISDYEIDPKDYR
ncbi:MAG: sigma-54-dependent Fis family transcriptional regulator, partial [Candidatus Sumerlaeia bacterium]|nr:sigma-54-dependent Fis family transcriptional regulator [Candidatus Sumerlaeia bacterium]